MLRIVRRHAWIGTLVVSAVLAAVAVPTLDAQRWGWPGAIAGGLTFALAAWLVDYDRRRHLAMRRMVARRAGPLDVSAVYRARWRAWAILLYAGAAGGYFVMWLGVAAGRAGPLWSAIDGLISVIAGVAATAFMTRVRERATVAAEEVAQDQRVHVLAPLLHALSLVSGANGSGLRARLVPMLHTATRTGRTELDQPAVNALTASVRSAARRVTAAFDPEFAVGGLAFLGRFGNRRSVACAARIASWEATTPEEERVRDAARACLDELRERLGRSDPAGQLLRPSALTGRVAALLHPATRAVTEQEELPRASEPCALAAPEAGQVAASAAEAENRGGR